MRKRIKFGKEEKVSHNFRSLRLNSECNGRKTLPNTFCGPEMILDSWHYNRKAQTRTPHISQETESTIVFKLSPTAFVRKNHSGKKLIKSFKLPQVTLPAACISCSVHFLMHTEKSRKATETFLQKKGLLLRWNHQFKAAFCNPSLSPRKRHQFSRSQAPMGIGFITTMREDPINLLPYNSVLSLRPCNNNSHFKMKSSLKTTTVTLSRLAHEALFRSFLPGGMPGPNSCRQILPCLLTHFRH